MRKIEFTKSVACDGRRFEAGAVVDASAVPSDHLTTCLRLGYAREHAAPAVEPTVLLLPPEVAPETARAVLAATNPVGPTEDDMRAAVAEIERVRVLAAERAQAIDQANGRAAALEAENADLKAKLAEREAAAKPVGPVSAEAESEHPPAPEPKAEDKPAGPKPVGPTKPPELKKK